MPKSKRQPIMRKPNVTKGQLEKAMSFLENDPLGKRAFAAENMLILLTKGHLPNIKHYIFNASYDLRRIADPNEFDRLINLNPSFADLVRSTSHGGYIRVAMDNEQIRFFMFYDKQLSIGEADLFSKSFGQVTAATLAVLGIDMSQYFSTDKPTKSEVNEMAEKLRSEVVMGTTRNKKG